jgi:hypothetical protein
MSNDFNGRRVNMRIYIVHRADAGIPVDQVRVVAQATAESMQDIREQTAEWLETHVVTFLFAVVDCNGETLLNDTRRF